MSISAKCKRKIGSAIAKYLSKQLKHYVKVDPINPNDFKSLLHPGDLLLVEGDTRFSKIVKYLTQSTWSHVAMYSGPRPNEDPLLSLIEADVNEGVIRVPLSKYKGYNVRICRPMGLSEEDRERVICYMEDRLGYTYDLKNIFDLMRYLLPLPPFLSSNRRRYLEIGSGDPSKGICSSLIAQAFQSIHYPILPRRGFQCVSNSAEVSDETLLKKQHYSLFVPRDFDQSPYFSIYKPTLEGFNYKALRWEKKPQHDPEPACMI